MTISSTKQSNNSNQWSNQHTSPNPNSLVINLQIHKSPIIHPSFSKSLLFEILILIYYCILIFVSTSTDNIRIMLYCLLFVIQEFIKLVSSLIDSIDPLAIGPTKMFLHSLSWIIMANMLYLLCVLAYLQHQLLVFIMFAHFIVAMHRTSRPDPSYTNTSSNNKGRSFYKVMDFINPILLYRFLKQFDDEQSDLSIIFLIFLCCNLLFASQIRLILNHQQSDFFGWSYLQKSQPKHRHHYEHESRHKYHNQPIWDRSYALKLLIISCCILLVLENFLVFFQSIKNQVCLNIMHTLIVAGTGYVISRKNTIKN